MAIKWGLITAYEAGLSRFSIAYDFSTVINLLSNRRKVLVTMGLSLMRLLKWLEPLTFYVFLLCPD